MTKPKHLRPSMDQVHDQILTAHSAQSSETKANAVDAIKEYGVDTFFCEYDDYLWNRFGVTDFYVVAAKMYHSSKQHWRRKP